MKIVFASLFLAALTAAACGTVNAPASEHGNTQDPLRAGTAAPAVAPSPAALPGETVPMDQNPAPASMAPSRPMADNEATTAPAPNAPARAVPQPTDRCIGPASTESKTPPPACPPQ
jgi:hypothetical protein